MDQRTPITRVALDEGQDGNEDHEGSLAENLLGLAFPRSAVTYRRPFSLYNIELTNHCPFKCIMCPRTNNMNRDLGFMEFAVFKKAIDELIAVNPNFVKRKKELWLTHFGESLEHPEFARFVAYGAEKGIQIALSINPLMVKERIARRLIEAGPALILFSLDGHDDESFFKIRGVKNAFEKSKKNLLRFIELNRQHGGRVRIALHMIGFSANEESYAEIGDYWSNLEGIDDFAYRKFTTWDGAAEDVNAFVGKKIHDGSPPRKRKVLCRKPWWRMTIAWDGRVLPCCLDYDAKMVLGNIKEQSLSEIWNGPKMKRLRREFLSGRVTNPLCRNCDALYEPDPAD